MLCSTTHSCCDQSSLPVLADSATSRISWPFISARAYSRPCSTSGGPRKKAPASFGSSSPVVPPTSHFSLPSVFSSRAISRFEAGLPHAEPLRHAGPSERAAMTNPPLVAGAAGFLDDEDLLAVAAHRAVGQIVPDPLFDELNQLRLARAAAAGRSTPANDPTTTVPSGSAGQTNFPVVKSMANRLRESRTSTRFPTARGCRLGRAAHVLIVDCAVAIASDQLLDRRMMGHADSPAGIQQRTSAARRRVVPGVAAIHQPIFSFEVMDFPRPCPPDLPTRPGPAHRSQTASPARRQSAPRRRAVGA